RAGGVGRQPLHVTRVPGRDRHHVVPVVLHQLHQRVDGLPTEVVALPGQRVRLVDEQHAAAGPGEDLGRLDRVVPYLLPDQVGPGDLDELTGPQYAHRVEELPVQPGHGGLAGTGRP